MSIQEICFMTAQTLVQKIQTKELSVVEVMQAHLCQIERINPKVNAIVTLLPERALAQAKAADEALAKRKPSGCLFGLPIAHKDLVLTKGIRTTLGSPIFKDFVPQQDALIVERLKQAGAVTIGKTNTPEFGAGSQTFNEVFGETLNPYNISKTCGGSSGGAAVALACGMLPIADGSDMGGSLRNPASFCNVVGLRPSPGRVPTWPSFAGWSSLSVQGPMARTVKDAALMLSAIAGPDPRSPISITEPGSFFSRSLARNFKNTRIAWSPCLDSFPVSRQVTAVIEKQRHVFQELGCLVEERTPDFSAADEIFKVLRAWIFELSFAELFEAQQRQMKDTVVWNIKEGRNLTGPQIGKAERQRTELFDRIRQFMETYEFIILPVSQVPPFDVKHRYVAEINDVAMETYIDWMKSCYFISTIGNPAISVPCGFTSDGLPIGVQIVGRHRDDFGVLQLAYAFEQATGFWKQRPPVVA
jgi:amidase